jgi:hypothetical protein
MTTISTMAAIAANAYRCADSNPLVPPLVERVFLLSGRQVQLLQSRMLTHSKHPASFFPERTDYGSSPPPTQSHPPTQYATDPPPHAMFGFADTVKGCMRFISSCVRRQQNVNYILNSRRIPKTGT